MPAARSLPGDLDLHLFNEGRHLRLWEMLGAHRATVDGIDGTTFSVWAPNAERVSVLGDFNAWTAAAHPLAPQASSGVWSAFVPDVGSGALYKFHIVGRDGAVRIKTDPMARRLEPAPGFASIVEPPSTYAWQDARWMEARARRDAMRDAPREPLHIYEVHLGSWRHDPQTGQPYGYREVAPLLAAHVRALGFTHVELLPIQEHPFGGSWGYQVGAYYAPTCRYGSPDDLRYFVDTMHDAGIGVILDWVPAHFPKDDWALRRFDGTACYEHEDPRLGDHPEWGTHIFNYGRHEVRNFLVANALYWIDQFHIDGLRVDAVASMLYLDYGRKAGEWLRNRNGGRENLEAVAFLQQLNAAVHATHPGVLMIAEESTSWPKVTAPVHDGGLGFTFKWNMGWMHDSLAYFATDPLFRKHAHDRLTFAMWYEYSERFLNSLSHDEVVHLKKSLLSKMPGDPWQQFANLRALLGYSLTRPGKTLWFMGTELAPEGEWNHDRPLPWHSASDPARTGLQRYLQAIGALYRTHPCFWRQDHDPAGFRWVDVADREHSVFSYLRLDDAQHALVILNLTPVPREAYRFGVPSARGYRVVLNSDDPGFGGSGYPCLPVVHPERIAYHGFAQSLTLSLPPLSMLVLMPGDIA